jgi:hypothetical protein
MIACPWAINEGAPFGFPEPEPEPEAVAAPGASVVVGVLGVKTAGVAARHEETAALTAETDVGAAELTVAFPAKLHD